MLAEVKQRVADHKNGDRLVSQSELKNLEKKAEIFQKKLDQMAEIPDEREIERILQREKLIKEREEARRRERVEL